MSVYNIPGRGRKQCNACKKYVGVRSHACEACGASFTVAVARPRVARPNQHALQVFPPLPEKKVETVTIVKSDETEKGSRIDRINYLKRELVRELRNSSRGYSASVLKEISDIVLAEWE